MAVRNAVYEGEVFSVIFDLVVIPGCSSHWNKQPLNVYSGLGECTRIISIRVQAYAKWIRDKKFNKKLFPYFLPLIERKLFQESRWRIPVEIWNSIVL